MTGILRKYVPYKQVEIMQAQNIKQAAHELVDQLSNDSTWDDLLYEIVVRKEIEAGLADSEAGRVTPVEDVMKEFGFNE